MTHPIEQKQKRKSRGFRQIGGLAPKGLDTAAAKRGFSEGRVLTHWADIVGPDIAAIAQPVKITHGQSFGATLTVLSKGAHAPILEMQKTDIVDKVNACYGYRAISRVQITQTTGAGFAEPQAGFLAKPAAKPRRAVAPEIVQKTNAALDGVQDTTLREALAQLSLNVLTKR